MEKMRTRSRVTSVSFHQFTQKINFMLSFSTKKPWMKGAYKVKRKQALGVSEAFGTAKGWPDQIGSGEGDRGLPPTLSGNT